MKAFLQNGQSAPPGGGGGELVRWQAKGKGYNRVTKFVRRQRLAGGARCNAWAVPKSVPAPTARALNLQLQLQHRVSAPDSSAVSGFQASKVGALDSQGQGLESCH